MMDLLASFIWVPMLLIVPAYVIVATLVVNVAISAALSAFPKIQRFDLTI